MLRTLLVVLSLGTALAATADAQNIPLSARSKGSPNAPIVVYEMSDFQCPFCRRHALETFPSLDREYIQTGKVRWVFVNLPLTSIHPNAVPAAAVAMCAAKHGKFWPAHDLIFRHQETWGPLRNPAPFFLTLIDSLRLPKAPMTACLEKDEMVAQIRSDAEGAVKSGAQSTPTFYVEGGLIVGSQPLQLFRAVLDSLHAAKTRKP